MSLQTVFNLKYNILYIYLWTEIKIVLKNNCIKKCINFVLVESLKPLHTIGKVSVNAYIKPLHTIGKVSVNASIHKHTIGKVSVNASIHKAITHYW